VLDKRQASIMYVILDKRGSMGYRGAITICPDRELDLNFFNFIAN